MLTISLHLLRDQFPASLWRVKLRHDAICCPKWLQTSARIFVSSYKLRWRFGHLRSSRGRRLEALGTRLRSWQMGKQIFLCCLRSLIAFIYFPLSALLFWRRNRRTQSGTGRIGRAFARANPGASAEKRRSDRARVAGIRGSEELKEERITGGERKETSLAAGAGGEGGIGWTDLEG